MANEKHLYVVAQGSYVGASLSAEGWQVGCRYYAAPGGTPDSVGTFSSAWDVVADTIARVETDWRIDGNWRVEGGINDLNVDDWLNDQLAPAFTSWMTDNLISNQVRLDSLKVYPIGAPTGVVIPAAPYAVGSPVTLTWTSNAPVGGGGTPTLPPQISIVASHRTGQIGRKGRGRMFLPALGSGALNASTGYGRMSNGAQTAALAAQIALLTDTQLDVPGAGFWCLPAVTGTPWDKYALITQVQVGDVFDTQRRRRNQLSEAIASDPVVNPA